MRSLADPAILAQARARLFRDARSWKQLYRAVHGELDRRALPLPTWQQIEWRQAYEAPELTRRFLPAATWHLNDQTRDAHSRRQVVMSARRLCWAASAAAAAAASHAALRARERVVAAARAVESARGLGSLLFALIWAELVRALTPPCAELVLEWVLAPPLATLESGLASWGPRDELDMCGRPHGPLNSRALETAHLQHCAFCRRAAWRPTV